MKQEDVKNAYANGPKPNDSFSSQPSIRKSRRSKLQPEAVLILKFWSAGKSLRFICHRLKMKSIHCSPTTVMRFLNKSVSL